MYLEIPVSVVIVLALLIALEYFLRSTIIKPFNGFWLGKAITRLYIATVYLFSFFDGIPSDLRHFLTRFGIVAMFSVDLFYIILEHFIDCDGLRNRSCWSAVLVARFKQWRLKKNGTNDRNS